MKKELMGSLNVLNNALEGIEVKGRSNVLRMRDAFIVLDGICKYVNDLPDGEAEE